MNKIVIGVIIAVIIIVGVVALNSNRNDEVENGAMIEKKEEEVTKKESDAMKEIPEITITMTKDGFSPKEITIKKGREVTFVNTGTIDQWPATAIHPTHRVYPGSDIKDCGTAQEATMFDACESIKPGASYSFVFNEVGTWRYHDHLNATLFGSVVVEE